MWPIQPRKSTWSPIGHSIAICTLMTIAEQMMRCGGGCAPIGLAGCDDLADGGKAGPAMASGEPADIRRDPRTARLDAAVATVTCFGKRDDMPSRRATGRERARRQGDMESGLRRNRLRLACPCPGGTPRGNRAIAQEAWHGTRERGKKAAGEKAEIKQANPAG